MNVDYPHPLDPEDPDYYLIPGTPEHDEALADLELVFTPGLAPALERYRRHPDPASEEALCKVLMSVLRRVRAAYTKITGLELPHPN